MAGAAERLGLGLGDALERTERDPLDDDPFARRWTVSRTISVRTSGADWGAAAVSLEGASPEASATVARAPRATTVTPAAI